MKEMMLRWKVDEPNLLNRTIENTIVAGYWKKKGYFIYDDTAFDEEGPARLNFYQTIEAFAANLSKYLKSAKDFKTFNRKERFEFKLLINLLNKKN